MNDLAVFFDDFFSRNLLATAEANYPPYNVFKEGDDLVLEMAVAGFKQEDLTVSFDGQRLIVRGNKPAAQERAYLTRTLSARNFVRTFAVSGQFEAEQPTLEDGVLSIKLKSTHKARVLPILSVNSAPQLTAPQAQPQLTAT